MPSSTGSSLTERQKECLRLVALHYDSKQIARQLNISHHTVNKDIEGASRILGVSDRRAAALALAELEHGPGYERLVYESLGLERAVPPELKNLLSPPAQSLDEGTKTEARDAAAVGSAYQVGDAFGGLREKGNRRNELTTKERLKMLGIYVLGILLALTLVANIAETVLRALLKAIKGI